MAMQQKLIQKNLQTLICSAEDFLVKHSVLLEKGEVLKIPEAHCFLTLQESLKLKDLHIFSLKMLRAYSVTTKGRLSVSSSIRFRDWGMMLSGWFLTASFLEFPKTENVSSLSEVLEENPDQKYYLSASASEKLKSSKTNKGGTGHLSKDDGTAYCLDSGNCQAIAIPVLTPDREKKRQNGRRFKENGEPSFTLTAQDKHGVSDGNLIRRLTPLECERLQGFPDGWTEGVSDTRRYNQCGNAVTVNVVEQIIQRMLNKEVKSGWIGGFS